MKKILSLVMVIVLALCLGGCGQDAIPKADYSFSAQGFMRDCLLNHSKDWFDSTQEAYKIYKGKRFEISGKIFKIMRNEKQYNYQIILGILSLSNGAKLVLTVSVRDKNILDRLKEKDFIKMSCLYDGMVPVQKIEDVRGLCVCFNFIDGILVSKM